MFSSCRQFIRTFPCLVYSSSDVEDVDTTGEDHIYDELRYMCMERPVPFIRKKKNGIILSEDPLEIKAAPEARYSLRARYRNAD